MFSPTRAHRSRPGAASFMAACAVWITSATCGGGGPVEGAEPPPRVDIARQLLKRITVSFDRNNMEGAIEMISEEIDVPIEVIREDLQLEGITKCSSHALDEHGEPAVRILRKCLTKADPDGKLIYVVRRADPDQPEKVFITTLAGATKRGDRIPPEFSERAKQYVAEQAQREAARAEAARAERAKAETAVAQTPPTSATKSAAELLQKPITVQLMQNLEVTMSIISKEIGVPIEILDRDLQLEGITSKSNFFQVDETNRPAGEILRKVLAQMGRDQTVVIYVVEAKEPNGPETVFITTRAAATNRGDKIPPEFAEPEKKP